jgi:hypothetical protein
MIEALAETGTAPQLDLMMGDTPADRTMAKVWAA